MLNFFIAYDNIDAELGNYLHACFQDIEEVLSQISSKSLSTISGTHCTDVEVETYINSFNGDRFIFLGYTHGNIDALTVSKIPFIHFTNAIKFKDSFFYTCACLSAVRLGPELEKNGCLVYIGYDKEVKIVFRLADIFIKCKNSGIKYFLESERTIGQTYQYMKDVYQVEVDTLANQSFDDFVVAAVLQGNMEALICLGNKELTLDDFILQ